MASVEDLYKAFGVIADAKDKAGEVSLVLDKFLRTKTPFIDNQPFPQLGFSSLIFAL